MIVRPKKIFRWCGICATAVSLNAADTLPAADQPLTVHTPRLTILFTPDGNIASIDTRYVNAGKRMVKASFAAGNKNAMMETGRDAGIESFDSSGTPVRNYVRSETDSAITIRFHSGFVEKEYVVRKGDCIIDAVITGHPGAAGAFGPLRFVFRPEIAQGGACRYFSINKRNGKVGYLRKLESAAGRNSTWSGTRNRFWVTMVTPESQRVSMIFNDSAHSFSAALPDASRRFGFRIYAGPVVYEELKKAGHECTKLLYPLWFWMRWLSFGLQFLFDLLLRFVGNPVVAVVALSISVKIIIAPLYSIANRWQRQVNVRKSLLQPRLDEINKTYRGEEHNRRTLAVYKELGIHPLYTLKSLSSAAIQIPIFFAAYHMLSEHIALQGIPFLWIEDLSAPDHFLALPFSMPYAGNHLNLLPFIMTAITFVSSWIHTDHSLSPALLKQQRRSLYLLAGLFFVLLYTSPAGMVIYWTMNNILAFISTVVESVAHKKTQRLNGLS